MAEPLVPRLSGAEVDPHHPHHLVIHEGYTYLHARLDGRIGDVPDEGLVDVDTRILSWWRLTIGGLEPIGSAVPSETSEAVDAVLTARPDPVTDRPEGPRLPQDTIEVRLHRRVGLGMLEELRLTNHSMATRDIDLVLELGADFRDAGEVGKERRQHGRIDHHWDPARCALTFTYTAHHEGRTLERGSRWRLLESVGTPVVAVIDGAGDEVRYRCALPVTLPPKGTVHLRAAVESLVDGRWRSPVDDDGGLAPALDVRRRRRQAAVDDRPVFESSDPLVPSILRQAADDLLSLRNWDLERECIPDGPGWLLNAGVPSFTGFFGRDSFAAGIQAGIVAPAILRGALDLAARSQGTEHDDWREEQPGRIVHEMRRGPLAMLGFRPHQRYYGSHTGAAAFVHGLSELWHWTGDLETVRRYRPAAERALAWARDWGDLDGDGLIEYLRRSPEGLKNQGWKDSEEAIRYPDGRIVENPIATVEEQAFHYTALTRMASMLVALEDDEAADRYAAAAARVRELIEGRFWQEDLGTYALALDRDEQPVRSIGSDAIHLLAAGVPSPEHARRVVDRLFQEDLWTGWGVRTLSSEHPSYDPFAYHLGSFWPVEAGFFAHGCKRYGFDDEVERIAGGLLAAAGHCHRGRLPEVLAGLDAGEIGVPVTYPGSKSPQAWSASATFAVIQAMLGIQPFAPMGALNLIRPRLPTWLPDLTIRRLRVGAATVDVRFERQADGRAAATTLERDGKVATQPAPPPNGEPLGIAERAARAALLVMPGRLPRASRLAMGYESR
jgi:glycogen debranching enzyme